MLNNREIAILVWATLLLALALSRPGVRSASKAVVRAFFNRYILTACTLMVAYVALVVYMLSLAGLWQLRQLKDTLIWLIVVAFASFFRLPEKADDPIYFKDALKDNLKIIVIIEFIIAFYPASLLVELILVPFATLLGLLIVFAERFAARDTRYAPTLRFLNGLAMLMGAAVLIYAFLHLIAGFSDFATLQTLGDFVLPAILTIAYLPFIFFITAFSNYQRDFRLLKLAIKDPRLHAYARRQAIRQFRFRTSLTRRWIRDLHMTDIRTTADVDRLIAGVKERFARERHPPHVQAAAGWSPYQANGFLVAEGLETGYYEPSLDDVWYAEKSRNVSDKTSLNTLTYTIEGTSIATTSLCLSLHSFYGEPRVRDMAEFGRLANTLFHRALHQALDQELLTKILTEDRIERRVAGRTVSATHETWGIGDRSGFTLALCIKV